MNVRLLLILNTISGIAVLLFNYLANALPVNGVKTGDVSAMYPTFFTPAGFTFAVWGIIYILMIGFLIHSLYLYKSGSLYLNKTLSGISFWFLLSCLANIIWLLTWHHFELFFSLACIIILLYSLMKMYVLSRHFDHSIYSFKVFVSIYLSWLSVATMANFAIYLSSMGWQEYFEKPEFLSILLLIMSFVLALYFLIKLNDNFFPVIIIWAAYGIYKQMSDVSYILQNSLVANISLLVCVLLLVIWITKVFRMIITEKFIKN